MTVGRRNNGSCIIRPANYSSRYYRSYIIRTSPEEGVDMMPTNDANCCIIVTRNGKSVQPIIRERKSNLATDSLETEAATRNQSHTGGTKRHEYARILFLIVSLSGAAENMEKYSKNIINRGRTQTNTMNLLMLCMRGAFCKNFVVSVGTLLLPHIYRPPRNHRRHSRSPSRRLHS